MDDRMNTEQAQTTEEARLVLSLFPGIGLLDMAFEEMGFCVVRGPDQLWGGDIRAFHPVPGRFDGVIGGPPCQCFSRINALNVAQGRRPATNLIPEFERCIAEAQPDWFLMENVPEAPRPDVVGYLTCNEIVEDMTVGGETKRKRRFSFGTRDGRPLNVEFLALWRPNPENAVLARSTVWDPKKKRPMKNLSNATVKDSIRLQGLPDGFLDNAPLTVEGKQKVIGNGVPLAMGRAIAKAIRKVMYEG